MTVLEIIQKYLDDNNFDGLCNGEIPCGCSKGDLAPCGAEGIIQCEPAYECKCDGCDEWSGCFTTSTNRECWNKEES